MAFIYNIGSTPWRLDPQDPTVQHNIEEAFNVLYDYMTLEAMAGIFGNILRESAFNPGAMQGTTFALGTGLIQWTPADPILNYASRKGGQWYDGKIQCQLILDELIGLEPGYIPKGAYSDISGADFLALKDVETATRSYYVNRERGADYEGDMAKSIPFALEIYEYLKTLSPRKDLYIYGKHAKYRRMKQRGIYI